LPKICSMSSALSLYPCSEGSVLLYAFIRLFAFIRSSGIPSQLSEKSIPALIRSFGRTLTDIFSGDEMHSELLLCLELFNPEPRIRTIRSYFLQ